MEATRVLPAGADNTLNRLVAAQAVRDAPGPVTAPAMDIDAAGAGAAAAPAAAAVGVAVPVAGEDRPPDARPGRAARTTALDRRAGTDTTDRGDGEPDARPDPVRRRS